MKEYFRKLLDDSRFNETVPWKAISYASNEVIIRDGDSVNSVFMVMEGTVHVKIDVDVAENVTREAGLAKLSENEIFGELSMFDSRASCASVVASSDCKVAVIDAGQLGRFLDTYTDYGYQFMRYIVERMVERMRQDNVRTGSVLSWYYRECGDVGGKGKSAALEVSDELQ